MGAVLLFAAIIAAQVLEGVFVMIGIKNVIAIVCGGGPAPGINSVISGVVNEAHRQGWDVLGIYDGFSRLWSGYNCLGSRTCRCP